MEIRRGITELLEAIPERIEVSGAAPTWQVTGASFESAAAYAQDAFEDPVVLERHDRSRWWPRVTLTVTTDPELAATAPPLESLLEPEPDPLDHDNPEAVMEPDPHAEPDDLNDDFSEDAEAEEPDEDPVEDVVFESFLEEIFDRQERLREQRARIPEQRRRRA
jgi:hypothetical protein